MINQSTLETLRKMKLSSMASTLEEQFNDAEKYKDLGFEERLGLLVDAEWNRRQKNKLKRGIEKANLVASNATIESIEYHEDRKLDKGQFLRFSTCQYIEDNHHIILKGASGNGKTFLACALGNAACRKFKTVKYTRMPELLDEFSLAKECGTLKKMLNALRKINLLIIDEWLIRHLTPKEAYDLLEIIEIRSNHGSTIFCTQYETDGWYERISPNNDGPVADAVMDRIVHNSYSVHIEGKISMRERHGISASGSGGGTDDK